MGFTEILTLIFVVLKLTGFIDWSWLLILAPAIVGFVVYIIVFLIGLVAYTR